MLIATLVKQQRIFTETIYLLLDAGQKVVKNWSGFSRYGYFYFLIGVISKVESYYSSRMQLEPGMVFRHDSTLSIDSRVNKDPSSSDLLNHLSGVDPMEMNLYELNRYITEINFYFDVMNKKMRSYRWKRLGLKLRNLFASQEKKQKYRERDRFYKEWQKFIPIYQSHQLCIEIYRNRKEWEKIHQPAVRNLPFF